MLFGYREFQQGMTAVDSSVQVAHDWCVGWWGLNAFEGLFDELAADARDMEAIGARYGVTYSD